MGKAGHQRFFRFFWILIFILLLIPVGFVASAALGLMGELPTFEELENPHSNLASEIWSADQVLIGKYYEENRTPVSYHEISPNVIHALIATEDARYYQHSGIDFRALGRVFYGAVTGNTGAGGGSTITQQLAKMLFHERPDSRWERIKQKLKEWVIAVRLERHYTKEEILAMYLNRFDFINNAVGIKSAARIYFNTSQDSLSITEAATLVGMAKNPSLFNPRRRPDTTMHRRNVVMYQMSRYSNPHTGEPYLDREAYDTLKLKPLELDFVREDHTEGIATYFREYLRGYLTEWARNHKKPDGSTYNLYKDGLRIYTTLNSTMQKYAEEAVSEHLGGDLQPEFFKHWDGRKNAPFYRLSENQVAAIMEQAMKRSERYRNLREMGWPLNRIREHFNEPVEMSVFTWSGERDTIMSPKDSILYYKHFLQTGFMAMDPVTGYIRAWVGGINYKHFKYDHVKQSRRQVGSTFKPFVYALAMQEFWSPCLKIPNVKVSIELPEGGVWTPQNSDGEYGGEYTLKQGLAQSINTITAYIIKQFGPQAVVDLVRRMGISSPIDPVPSIALGTPDISVYEMVGAMAAFANKGVWTEPMFITRIEDKNGNILQEFIPKRQEALSEEAAYLTLNLMQAVTDYGTGVRLRYRYNLRTPIAGKTGTTQNNSDGWFMGLTPDLVAGVWVGAEDRSVHFRTTAMGQGATMALPVWAKFFQKVYADTTLKISTENFERPEGELPETNCKALQEDGGNDDDFSFDD